MPVPPSCSALGRQCRELRVTLRIADLREDDQTFWDAAATWLLGHTGRIDLGEPYVRRRLLLVDALIRVPCKHLAVPQPERNGGPPTGRCKVHGYRGPLPAESRRTALAPQFRQSDGRRIVVYKGKRRPLDLPLKRAARRALTVMQGANPCDGAPCRTADNTRGAACCRDLTLDVMVPESDIESEALLKSRKSPYLCKVERADAGRIECEVISACNYLEDDGVACALHDRLLPNNRPAKPSICWDWPDLGPDDVGHPGCVLLEKE
jgi:hypothetical protein